MTCCSHMARVGGALGRIVALDWYDGITEGVAECRECTATYRVRMLAWDEQQDERVYSLTPLTVRLSEVINLLEPLGEPRWPVWLPAWDTLPRERIEALQSRLESVLTPNGPVEMVLVSENLPVDIRHRRCLRGVQDNQQFETLRREQGSFGEWLDFVKKFDMG
jgi:hypothetical protein